MKLVLLLFACVGLSFASLSDDLLDFIGVIPLDEWMEVSSRFRVGDTEYQRVLRYLQSGEGWSGLVERVRQNAEWIEFKDWMMDRGVDLDARIQQIHDLIAGLEIGDGGNMGGLRAFVDECLQFITLDDIASKLDELLRGSADFREFFEELSSDDTRNWLEGFLFVDAEFQRLVGELTAAGINVDRIKEIVYGILGWI